MEELFHVIVEHNNKEINVPIYSWAQYYKLINNNYDCSCLNCNHNKGGEEPTRHIMCMRDDWFGMVDLTVRWGCTKWTAKESE